MGAFDPLIKMICIVSYVIFVVLGLVVTVVGLVFAHLLGGQVITENVFSWNGIGRLAIQAMLQRDYPLVQGFIVIFATSIVLVTTALDLLYVLLDPRVRRR